VENPIQKLLMSHFPWEMDGEALSEMFAIPDVGLPNVPQSENEASRVMIGDPPSFRKAPKAAFGSRTPKMAMMTTTNAAKSQRGEFSVSVLVPRPACWWLELKEVFPIFVGEPDCFSSGVRTSSIQTPTRLILIISNPPGVCLLTDN